MVSIKQSVEKNKVTKDNKYLITKDNGNLITILKGA